MTIITNLAMTKPDRLLDSSVRQLNTWNAPDTALWYYLFLPVLIFLPGFFVPSIGVPVGIIAIVAAANWLPRRFVRIPRLFYVRRDAVVSFCAVAMIAAAWTVLGGAGHVFYANSFDWVPRFAVLRDLVVQDWPPHYADGNGREFILRAPVGYYLPAAWLARGVGVVWADAILLAWTWLGVTLLLVANLRGTLFRKLGGAALFACASGLDVVGIWQASGALPWLGGHLEWWAGRVQYSSNTTLLFWVPNHALPGWIAAAWLWRFRDDPRFVSRLPILFLPVMLWSPLPAIGLLPLAIVAAWSQWRRGCFQWAEFFKSLALVAPATGLIAGYLLMSAGSIDAGISAVLLDPQVKGAGTEVWKIVRFFILEAGLFAMLALYWDRSPLLLASITVLAVLPFIHFGPNNDLAMRGSVPSLTILWLVLINELTAEPEKRALSRPLRVVLVALWIVGAATPFQEVYRALASRQWKPDTGMSLPVAMKGFPAHYFASAANRFALVLNRTEPLLYSKCIGTKSTEIRDQKPQDWRCG